METLSFRKPINNKSYYISRLVIVCFIAILFSISASNSQSATSNDLHYSSAGFFDIHVCNWPDRPLFFMALFSTYNFNDISNILVFSPDNKIISELNLKQYRLFKDKNNKEKRVFINRFKIPAKAKNGWYYTKVNLKDGSTITAKDYVIIDKLNIAKISSPDIKKTLTTIPKSFILKKTKGVKYYHAFIRDSWDSKLIYKTKLINKPEIHIPDNLLEKGGVYTIQIHSRDTNGHQLIGDFNHGSLTNKIEFSIAE